MTTQRCQRCQQPIATMPVRLLTGWAADAPVIEVCRKCVAPVRREFNERGKAPPTRLTQPRGYQPKTTFSVEQADIHGCYSTRARIVRRDGGRCRYCGRAYHAMTLDHILPKSRGGGNTLENLALCCFACNNRKGNRTPAEAGMRLLEAPGVDPGPLPGEEELR